MNVSRDERVIASHPLGRINAISDVGWRGYAHLGGVTASVNDVDRAVMTAKT